MEAPTANTSFTLNVPNNTPERPSSSNSVSRNNKGTNSNEQNSNDFMSVWKQIVSKLTPPKNKSA